jgi:hypothetical protein
MAHTGTTPEASGRGHGPIVGVDHPIYPLAVHATYMNGPGPHHDDRGEIWPNKNTRYEKGSWRPWSRLSPLESR